MGMSIRARKPEWARCCGEAFDRAILRARIAQAGLPCGMACAAGQVSG
jgi:hypothetical protein